MAVPTFSGSPAPRRTNRTAPRPSGFSPPPRRAPRVGSSKPASRFATPHRGGERLSSIRDDASVASAMDVDGGGFVHPDRALKADTLFAKSDELHVSFHAHLPPEVKQVLRAADFFRDAYTGDIDTMTGFALVATSQTCFVWQHSQALSSVPTCYIFPCPVDRSQTAPFHAFVPYGVSREPGLVLVSSSGEIRFWDSISIGLAGGEPFSRSQLELEAGETASSLSRSDLQTYISSTSKGRLFRLTLTSTGGKYHLVSRLFSRPQSSLSLSRFLPSLWSSQILQPEAGNITAIALGEQNSVGRDLWALVDSRLQKWNLATEGWEEIAQEEEIAAIILPSIRGSLNPVPDENAYLDLELLDIAVESTGKLLILTSYSGTTDDLGVGNEPTPRRIYALVRLTVSTGFANVDDVTAVPYQSTFGASEAPMHPQLQLVEGGQLAVVQFGDAVTICARGRAFQPFWPLSSLTLVAHADNDYKDRVELKSPTDRTLGVGVVDDQSEILIMTSGLMMKVTVDFEEVSKFDPETGQSKLIKSIMTQAILYGSHPENPLRFTFPPEIDEDSLMTGAEQLSRAILESDHEVVRPNNDLTSQMIGRKERLGFLIKFVNENGALGKTSQRCRQQLAADAEKLYAAQQLWLYLNEFLSHGNTYSVLNEAVYQYMNDVNEGHHEDFMRAYFRLRVNDLGKILPYVLSIAARQLGENPGSALTVLPEVNSIVLTVITSALEYRDYNRGVYGLEFPLVRPWTSKADVIDILLQLFAFTTNAVEGEGASHDDVAKTRLPELVSTIFACMTERIGWLKLAAAENELGLERELTAMEEQFQQLRPELLDSLRVNGFADSAFKLAEQYHDFRNLVSLCNKDTVYPPEQNPNALSIQAYIERFQDEFTDELYKWYIEHGELRAMFAQEDTYSDYIDRFFTKHWHPSISWIHDLRQNRYDAAAESLLSESHSAGELTSKQLMLSIGKLSHLAQLQEDDGAEATMLDEFHDGLDFVSVQETLTGELKSALASVRIKQTLDAQAETITAEMASKLADKPQLRHIFKGLVHSLLQGKALSMEELADALSLKDNTSHVEDYATALHLLSRASNLPEARRLAAFKNVWRRIYLHDDWNFIRHTSGVTDAELNERYRNSALFAVLAQTQFKLHQPAGYILMPSESLLVPTDEEIVSHWPGMSAEEREALVSEFLVESSQVQNYDLADVFARTRELVMESVVG
ncbi:hypothetical protein EVG20_g323 [Dentipellis fragilis]|uniref:Nucleoporin Nup133/Nup155-like C-terminal domain-containing protein n=1 Tax=Dentipellis fragilis TaxID=205917 RepID=A0A4Y9ZD26_9AGAM|nr:hypothetical protein EVG20_g323 [Dentipellis fragilis]